MVYDTCTYLKESGVCGARCYGERCHRHRNTPQRTPCKACGAGTRSKTGYCPCTTRQMSVGWKMCKAAKAEKKAIDAFIDEILAIDWSAGCDQPELKFNDCICDTNSSDEQ